MKHNLHAIREGTMKVVFLLTACISILAVALICIFLYTTASQLVAVVCVFFCDGLDDLRVACALVILPPVALLCLRRDDRVWR